MPFSRRPPSFVLPCMTLHPNENLRRPPPRTPPSHLLRTIQDAVRDNHLGQALNLLVAHPTLNLPQSTIEELIAKLRVRGLPHRADLIANLLEDSPSSSSAVHFLAQPHNPPDPSPSALSSDLRNHVQTLIRDAGLDAAIAHLDSVPPFQVDQPLLQDLLVAATQDGQIRHAHRILVDLFPRFAVLPSASDFVHFINASGRTGSIHRAISLHKHPQFPLLSLSCQSQVLCALIDACIRTDALSQADELVAYMRRTRIPLSERVYVTLLRSSHKSSNSHRTRRILDEMRRDGFSPRTLEAFNALLFSAAKAAHLSEAFRVFHSIRDSDSVSPNRDTYNALLSCCARAAQPDRAFQVLDLMRNSGDPAVYPNAKSYNWVVVACARVGDLDRALHVASLMRKERIRINVVTNNNLLEACCNAGRLEKAFSMTKDMIERQRVQPNSHTYNTLIRGCGRWGLLDAALRILSSMRTAGVSPTVITYSVAIDACARAGGAVAVDRAFDVLRQMEDAGIEPNIVTYNSLLHACALGKKVDLAFEVLGRLVNAGFKPDLVTLGTLVDACGRAGDVERAFLTFETLSQKYPSLRPNVPAYNALMHACFKAGDMPRMNRAFEDMKKRNLKPSVVTFSTMISAYASEGKMEKALYYLKEMKSDGHRPNRLTYTSIIAAYGRMGRVNLVMDMLEQARAQFGEPDEELYTAVIVAAVTGGSEELAVQLADEMTNAGYVVPTVLNRIMRRVGDVEQSGDELRQVMSTMEALNIRPQRAALESLISAYAKEADVEAAFDVLPDMERLGYPPNIQTYKKLIHACALSGSQTDINKAWGLFDMVRARVKDGDPQLSTHNWRELYEALLETCRHLPVGEESSRVAKRTAIQRMTQDCGKHYADEAVQRVFTDRADMSWQ